LKINLLECFYRIEKEGFWITTNEKNECMDKLVFGEVFKLCGLEGHVAKYSIAKNILKESK
jgi:hypothetical protein